MSLILCIETGTDVCSVALAHGGRLVSLREEAGRDHARKVALFADELFGRREYLPAAWMRWRSAGGRGRTLG